MDKGKYAPETGGKRLIGGRIVDWDHELGGGPAECRPPGDVDGDGLVGVEDLLLLLADWGNCPGPCPTDLNNDGTVNVFDLLRLLADWG